MLLLFNTTRTTSGPPSTRAAIAMDGGVADTQPAITQTKMRAMPTTAHNESSCLRFFARSFETLHARLLARFDGSPPDSQYLTQESHASPAIGHQLCVKRL